MNKKKKKLYTFTLLPPPRYIADLARINIDNFLYTQFEKSTQDDSVMIDKKTFKNVFAGKRKPHKSTVDKILQVMPLLIHDKYSRSVLLGDVSIDKDVNVWEMILESFCIGAGDYANDIFPFFQNKLTSLIEIEKAMNTEIKKLLPSPQYIKVYTENEFISKLMTTEDKLILDNIYCKQEDAEIVILMTLQKVILYITAHIDAEFSFGYKDVSDHRTENTTYGKVSLLQLISPKIEKNKIIGPVQRLFEKWRDNFNTTYVHMQQFINISTNGNEDLIKASQKNKFMQWRRGVKVARHEEVLNIIKGICPEIEKRENWRLEVLVLYHVSLFWSNYFKVLQELNKATKTFHKTDPELVDWMSENYDKFFNEAYEEVEKFYESA